MPARRSRRSHRRACARPGACLVQFRCRNRADCYCFSRNGTGLAARGSRIRTLGPALHTHRFGPPSCRPRNGPVRQTEIIRWRPGTKRSTPASAAEYTGPPPGGSPLARYRGGVISTHRPMGTPRARWCAPARSPPWFLSEKPRLVRPHSISHFADELNGICDPAHTQLVPAFSMIMHR